MKFSLIVATLGRKKELLDMLESIRNSCFDLTTLEVIIVDQNDQSFIMNDILSFDGINIKYIHSNQTGLSFNRNIGLRESSGEIICFPDDDCTFYKDTLSEVSSFLTDNKIDFCIGRIFDRNKNKSIIKKWPKNILSINKFNSYFLNSSITLFLKRDAMLFFDENLGVGAKYGSCEDADYIYRLLINKSKGTYNPNIEVWHPEPIMNEISLNKVSNYASGFTYFIKKNVDSIKIILFLLLFFKKIMQLIFYRNKFKCGYFKAFFKGLFLLS